MRRRFNKMKILKESLLFYNLYQTVKSHKIITTSEIETNPIFNNFCFKCFYLSFIDDSKKFKYRKILKEKYFPNSRIKLNPENTFHQQIAIYNLIDLVLINIHQNINLFDECITDMNQYANDELNKTSLFNYYYLVINEINSQEQKSICDSSESKTISKLFDILKQDKSDIDVKEVLLIHLSSLVFQYAPSDIIPYVHNFNIDYLHFLKVFDFQVTKGVLDKTILYAIKAKMSTIYQKDKISYIHLCFRLLYFFYLKKPHTVKAEVKNLYKMALNQIKIYISDNLLDNIEKMNQYKLLLEPYALELFNYKSQLKNSIMPINEIHIEGYDENQLNYLIKNNEITEEIIYYFSDLFEKSLFPMNVVLKSFIVIYNGIISSPIYLETKQKIFKKIFYYILLNIYSVKIQFLINLNLVKEMILNLFLWNLLQIKTYKNNKYESKISVIYTMKLFRRLFSRIEYKISSHDRLFYLFKKELEAYYYIGDYVSAKKLCYYLFKKISLDTKKGNDIKKILESCYIQLNKIKKNKS